MVLTLPPLHGGHISRCFQLRFGSSYGTAFLHSYGGKVAFVTAAHTLVGAEVGNNFWLRGKANWSTFKVTQLLTDAVQDICVFTLDRFIVSGDWIEPDISMLLAQPLIYLGFPHGLFGDYPGQTELVTPLAKVAHFSGNVVINDAELMVLDGLNNPGFSGSPLYHQQASSDNPQVSLVGMVHAFRYEQQRLGRVYRQVGENGDQSEPTADLFVKLNRGMILASGRVYIERQFDRLDQGLVIEPNPNIK